MRKIGKLRGYIKTDKFLDDVFKNSKDPSDIALTFSKLFKEFSLLLQYSIDAIPASSERDFAQGIIIDKLHEIIQEVVQLKNIKGDVKNEKDKPL